MDRHRVTVAVSVRPEVLAAAKQQVAQGHAPSLSAWVEQAMEEKAGRGEFAALLSGMPAPAHRTADDGPEVAPGLKPAPLPRRGRQVV